MNYHAFTIDSFTMMYEGARGALAADDTLSELGEVPGFRVRETPDWILRFDLETEAISQKLGRLKQQPAGSPRRFILVGSGKPRLLFEPPKLRDRQWCSAGPSKRWGNEQFRDA
jgi:hypothetical protein